MTKELLVLLSTAILLSAARQASGNPGEGGASKLHCCSLWVELLATAQNACLQADLVQIVQTEGGEEMRATVLTLGEGAKFKSVQQTTKESLFFLVTTSPTFDPEPKFLIMSCDGAWILRVDEGTGLVRTETIGEAGLAPHLSLPGYHFSLRGSLDNAQLISRYGGVEVIADGTVKVGVASNHYQVKVVTSVDTCSSKEAGKNNKTSY